MSDAMVKAEKSKAKDERQSLAPENVPPQKGKKKKPIIIEYKWNNPSFDFIDNQGWSKWGAYRNIEIAERVIKDEKRKHPDTFELRIRKENI